MKKNSIKESIMEINKVSAMFPKTLNEALNFNEAENYEMGPEMDEEPIEDVPMEEEQPKGMDVTAFVDDIRKQSLRGMAELADNPESEEYQILKKIWQICDKKPEQQPQRPMQQPQA